MNPDSRRTQFRNAWVAGLVILLVAAGVTTAGVCVQHHRGEDKRCRKQHGCRFEARSELHIKVPRIIIGWQKIHTPER